MTFVPGHSDGETGGLHPDDPWFFADTFGSMMGAPEKESRKTPELILVGRCVTRLVRRLDQAKAHLDADWGRMTEGDRGEVLARLEEVHFLTLAAAELRAAMLVRGGHGSKTRVQRRRRHRRRQGNQFQVILREAARRCAAA